MSGEEIAAVRDAGVTSCNPETFDRICVTLKSWMAANAAFAEREVELRGRIGELNAEVAYLRRQIDKDDNWKDPEFGGCTPDLKKPEHLKDG